MAVDNLLDVGTVAACHRDGDGHRPFAAGVENNPVPFAESAKGECQPAESIAVIGIRTRQEDRQVGNRFSKCRLQTVPQRRQIFGIARSVGQTDVEIAHFLRLGIVPLAVNRKRVNGWIIADDRRRAVPLMHVAVNYQYVGNEIVSLKISRRHDTVVEQTETLASIPISMMGAARQIDGTTVNQRGTAGLDRGSR